MYNASTQMTNNEGVYTLSVYLKEGEEFMFTSRNTIGGQSSTGAVYLRASNLDEASKAYLGGTTNNMTALASGTYTFTYNSQTEVLSVTFDAANVPAPADYYIDGTFNPELTDWSDYCFNPDYKLTDEDNDGVYEINSVTLAANSQIIIQAFKQGSTERGEWGTDGYNGLGSYNYTYLSGGGEAFSAVGNGNNNILVLTEGVYDITFDSYSKIITITVHSDSADTLDIYIKGGAINSWNHNWSADYLLTINEEETAYEIVLTFTAGDTFGLELHPKGETEGYGTFIGASAMGTSGDANANFTPESGNNFTVGQAGTYKLVYNIETGTVDFYSVNE